MFHSLITIYLCISFWLLILKIFNAVG